MSSVPPSLPLHPELPEGVERGQAPPPGATPPAGPGGGGFPGVPAWVPFLALVAATVASLIGSTLIGGIAAAAGADVDPVPPGVIIGGTIVLDLSLIGAAYLFARIWASGPVLPASFGLRLTSFWPAVGWAALAYLSFWLFAIAYTALLGEAPEQDIVDDFRKEDSVIVLVGFAAMVGIFAPLAEEFFFRGFVFGVLRERIGVAAAAFISGVIFGLVHAIGSPLQTLGLLVMLGVLFALLYWKTNSLLPCIALHALHNSISFGATRELPAWGFLGVIVLNVAIVLAVATAVTRARGPRAA